MSKGQDVTVIPANDWCVVNTQPRKVLLPSFELSSVGRGERQVIHARTAGNEALTLVIVVMVRLQHQPRRHIAGDHSRPARMLQPLQHFKPTTSTNHRSDATRTVTDRGMWGPPLRSEER